jgi:mevalonate kinase
VVNVEIKVPSNIKISGEHSVVFGGPSLSAATPPYATANLSDANSGRLEIVLNDFKISASFDEPTLRSLYAEYGKRDTTPKKPDDKTPTDLSKYITGHSEIRKEILPYATIAARLLVEQSINPINKQIAIHSDVPIGKGYASSAVCSTAFAMVLVKASGKQLDDQSAIDVSRDGERIVHGIETGGRLDVGPIYFGGYATFKASEVPQINSLQISTPINVVVMDVGPKPPTADMVKKVRALHDADPNGTDKILREIDCVVLKCIDALKSGDLKELGKQMHHNHGLLKQLGVSSDRLDNAVSIAMSNGAYGAKLCGGGGGGMGMALVGNDSDAAKVIDALKAAGFDAYSTSVTLKGAKNQV